MLKRLKNTDEIRTLCFEEGLIDGPELETLASISTSYKHNEALFRMLAGGNVKTLRTFIGILAKCGDTRHGYEDIVEDLCTRAVQLDSSFNLAQCTGEKACAYVCDLQHFLAWVDLHLGVSLTNEF